MYAKEQTSTPGIYFFLKIGKFRVHTCTCMSLPPMFVKLRLFTYFGLINLMYGSGFFFLFICKTRKIIDMA